MKARSPSIVAMEKGLCIKYSECMSVAVIIQHEKRMRRVILSSVSYLAVPHFSTHDFSGKKKY